MDKSSNIVKTNFTGFPKQSLEFLTSIKNNNNKEWFENHRYLYERLILEPSRAFVIEMGEHLQALIPTIHAMPKVNGSLFRIYRDIRFSKDKTPIKSTIGFIFWQDCGKRMQSSAFYLHFNPDELFFAVGIRKFSKELLETYREYIKDKDHRIKLHDILQSIKNNGYELPKAHYKRYPKGFDKDKDFAYLALFDGMYAYKSIKPKEVLFSYRHTA